MSVTIGDIVLYTMSDADVSMLMYQLGSPPQGANQAYSGEVYPAVVVRSWGGDLVNLQVLLDGAATYWATSRGRGTGHGQWSERAAERS